MIFGHRWDDKAHPWRCIFCGCEYDVLPSKMGKRIKTYRKDGIWTPDRPECRMN